MFLSKEKSKGQLYPSGVYSKKFSLIGYILSVVVGVLVAQFEMYLYYFLDSAKRVGIFEMLEWGKWDMGVFPFPIGVFFITVLASLFAAIVFLPTAFLAFLASRQIKIKSNLQFALAGIIASLPVIILISLTQSLLFSHIIIVLGWFLLPSACAAIAYRCFVNMQNSRQSIVGKSSRERT